MTAGEGVEGVNTVGILEGHALQADGTCACGEWRQRPLAAAIGVSATVAHRMHLASEIDGAWLWWIADLA